MLSKCANPDCPEVFLYLHQGKLFCLSPTPDLEEITRYQIPLLYERFWLCDRCSREMTLVWDGMHAKVAPLSNRLTLSARIPLATSAMGPSRHGHPLRHTGNEEDWAERAEEVHMKTAASTIQRVSKSVFRHILVATDFSEPSHRAVCNAKSLADEYDAQLSLVHVLQTDWKYAALENPPEIDIARIEAEERLEALTSELGSANKIDTILMKHGPVPEAVASLITETGVDLLVIGTRGLGGLRKLALGSVAEELLRTAPCPVMTIGPRADISAISHGPEFHAVLFATDFGPGSAKALPLALALAKSSEAKLILLHMIPPIPPTAASPSAYGPAIGPCDELPDWEQSSRKRALRELQECLPAVTGLAQPPEFIVGTDFLPEGILTAVKKFKVDLIVMGAARTASARAAAHLPWAAVHEVVSKAPCAVLTVAG